MEISQDALDALLDEAWAKGKASGVDEAEYEHRLVLAQFKKLTEILEVEGDQNLLDAAEHLGAECRAHREATRVAASVIERQRKEILELRSEIAAWERGAAQAALWADKQRAADQSHIRELHEAIEPKQQQIKELELKVIEQRNIITELRQALLKHVTETA
jgi:predicted RNase H-like nuclease (RuvC/YqgF family)